MTAPVPNYVAAIRTAADELTLTLSLPYPPSANTYWKVWRGRAVTSAEARQYKLTVALQNRGVVPFTGPVSVDLVVKRPAKRGDLDNSIKVLLDALKGIAYLDDKQVVQLSARRVEGTKADSGVMVTVRVIGTPIDC